ncbi:hypothetical protein [Serinibacter salmoneus]|uniref:Uncharacterized protein n=1 Tax=Serinibacter salmoneus TaxID=556530 RepID=A0A2A9D1Y6_9MICO|nr:hypothetical protein [Serinibacter salmoneus]PFG20728.1 hypothetical protein ATL40_2338 [Serinibacter salmoneus]
MKPADVHKLRELTLRLDLAYIHHHERTKDQGEVDYKSAEASVRLEFGNLEYRKRHPAKNKQGPVIEQVVIYSSIFAAERVRYFDSLDDALETLQRWLDHERSARA